MTAIAEHSKQSAAVANASSPTSTKLDTKIINAKDLYIQTNQLGSGAFGVVRLAKYNGKLVAVKALKLDNSNSKLDPLKAIELFADEAAKMSQISHPRIVEFIGFIMETLSIVMEYMSDGTLADYLKQNTNSIIPWSTRYWFIADIAEGMTYLHSKRGLNGKPKVEVFHQDLKPANILLNIENGVLRRKISDLGLAAIKDQCVDATASGAQKYDKFLQSNPTSFVAHQGGTYAYMAPELLRGSRKVRIFLLISFLFLSLYPTSASSSASLPRLAMYMPLA